VSETLSHSLSVYVDSESLKYVRDVLIISFYTLGLSTLPPEACTC